MWKDVVAKMNTDKASEYVIELIGDVNVKGALKLPKKGYQSLTINGNEPSKLWKTLHISGIKW